MPGSNNAPLQAVIGCMGDVDAYLLPDAKGYQAMLRHLLGEDDEYRQKVRDEIFGGGSCWCLGMVGRSHLIIKEGTRVSGWF